MLKKHEKIIAKVLSPGRDQFAKIGYDKETGFFYATDGYRMVRIDAEHLASTCLPIFDEFLGDKHPDYGKYIKPYADMEFETITIPYNLKTLKEWQADNDAHDRRIPFYLGKRLNGNSFTPYIGIDPRYLIDAIETTGSYDVLIPKKGMQLIMQGNGFLWIICPVQANCNEDKMTVIDTNVYGKEKSKSKVVLSTGSREDLQKMINEYFYSKNYVIRDDMMVYNIAKDAILENYIVREKKSRWQFVKENA